MTLVTGDWRRTPKNENCNSKFGILNFKPLTLKLRTSKPPDLRLKTKTYINLFLNDITVPTVKSTVPSHSTFMNGLVLTCTAMTSADSVEFVTKSGKPVKASCILLSLALIAANVTLGLAL